MLQSLALVSLLTSTALAQTYFANVSPKCLDYIKGLDSDSTLKACTSSLANATAAYGTAKDASKTFSSQDITTTLDTVCKTDYGCSSDTIKVKLSEFYQNCTQELTSNNTEVTSLYDAVYSYVPMKQSICGKDDSGSYCVLKTSGLVQSKPSLLTTLQQYLWNKGTAALSKRGDEYATPNMTTFSSTGVPFLFIDPALDYNSLCTACTRNTMTNYMTWQSEATYGPGMSASQLLKQETPLYQGITKTCGAPFLNPALQAAGGIGKGSSNGSLKAFGLDLVTVFIGIISMTFASTL